MSCRFGLNAMVKAAPQLIRLESHRSVYSKVAGFIKDDQLRQAFSFHSLLVGGNPFDTSSIYGLIHALERKGGVWFAKGGTGSLVNGMNLALHVPDNGPPIGVKRHCS